MTEPPKFKFLDDKCSDVDLTEDKTHQRIADQLFDLIESGDSKGLTIGLEGDWGSGKTTVVELLRQKLIEDEKTFFFYIDTWVHEGDPLRRAFLESMIGQLKDLDGIPDAVRTKLDEIRTHLGQQRSKAETTRTTTTTRFGVALGICALFVPFGVALVSAFAGHVTVRWTGQICWGFWWGTVLALAPVWAYAVQGMRWFRAYRQHRAGDISFAVFLATTNSQTDSTTTLAEERSSLEFAHCFESVVKIVEKRFDRIVMVIDNLDRIDPRSAVRIWSTLQTFTQQKNPQLREKGISGPSRWIVVPYAQEGFERIWDERPEAGKSPNESRKEEGQKSHPEPRERNGENSQGEQAASFMDKSFDLRLRVPKMLIGDWHTFAKQCIHEAAPGLSSEDAQTILDFLSWTRSDLADAPSPRQIKQYINHVGQVWQIHADHASLASVCFYVVLKQFKRMSDSEIEREILYGKMFRQTLPEYVDLEIDDVAGIMYGVSKDKAMRLLLGQIMEAGLQESATDQLQTWRKAYGEEVFDTVACHVFGNVSLDKMPKYVASIQRAFPKRESKVCEHAFQLLRKYRFQAKAMFPNIGHDDALSLIEFANSDPKIAKKLAEVYIQLLPTRFAGAKGEAVSEVDQFETGSEFVEKIRQVSIAARQEIKLPYAALADVSFPFQRLDENTMDELASCLADPENADRVLAKQIRNRNNVVPWHAPWLGALIRNGMRRMDGVLHAIENQFAEGQQANGSTDWSLLLALEYLPLQQRPIELMRKAIKFSRTGVTNALLLPRIWFLQLKYLDEETEDIDAAFRMMKEEMDDYFEQGMGTKEDVITEIFRYSKRSGEYAWLARAVACDEHPVAGEIITAAVENNESRLFDVPEPFGFLARAMPLVNDDIHDALFRNFIGAEGHLAKLGATNGETLTKAPKTCRMLLERCWGQAAHELLANKCVEELRHITQGEWDEAFEKSEELVKLVACLDEKNIRINLETEFYNAFKHLVQDAVENDYSPFSLSIMSSLYRSMAPTFQTLLGSTLGEMLLECNFDVRNKDLCRFVLEIPDYSAWLVEKPSDILDALAELTRPEDLMPLSHFVELLVRCREHINYWRKIKQTLKSPLERLGASPDEETKRMVKEIKDKLERCKRNAPCVSDSKPSSASTVGDGENE